MNIYWCWPKVVLSEVSGGRMWSTTLVFYIAWMCQVAVWSCMHRITRHSMTCNCNSIVDWWFVTTRYFAMGFLPGNGWISDCSTKAQHHRKLGVEVKSLSLVCPAKISSTVPVPLSHWHSPCGASKLVGVIKSVVMQHMWATAQSETGSTVVHPHFWLMQQSASEIGYIDIVSPFKIPWITSAEWVASCLRTCERAFHVWQKKFCPSSPKYSCLKYPEVTRSHVVMIVSSARIPRSCLRDMSVCSVQQC